MAAAAAGGARPLSGTVRRLHRALNALLSERERERFIHCLNQYHGRRNVCELVHSLRLLLDSPHKRQLLPLLRLVIPRSDQLLFDQYTAEGPYPSWPAGSPPLDSPVCGSGHVNFSTDQWTAPLSQSWAMKENYGGVRQVALKRNKTHEGLGFSIRGGSEHGVGIYVSLVEQGSLAEKEGLRVGDQILRVNDKVFEKVTHAEAVKLPRWDSNSFPDWCSGLRTLKQYCRHHATDPKSSNQTKVLQEDCLSQTGWQADTHA